MPLLMVEPLKIPLVLAMKIWWIRHENLVNFPWINSQDFNGFLFGSENPFSFCLFFFWQVFALLLARLFFHVWAIIQPKSEPNLTSSWQLLYVHQKAGNYLRSHLRAILGSLSSDVFERRTSTGNGLFAHLSRDFEQIFGQIVSLRIKTLGNTNTVA